MAIIRILDFLVWGEKMFQIRTKFGGATGSKQSGNKDHTN